MINLRIVIRETMIVTIVKKQEVLASFLSNGICEIEKGQSTAEFILAFGFMALFVVIFVQMGLNYTKGFVIQYATFYGGKKLFCSR